MNPLILFIEPKAKSARRSVGPLIGAAFDAVVVSTVDQALLHLRSIQPHAVVLSEHLRLEERNRVSAALTAVPVSPVVELSGEIVRAAARRPPGSGGSHEVRHTATPDSLIRVLTRIVEPHASLPHTVAPCD